MQMDFSDANNSMALNSQLAKYSFLTGDPVFLLGLNDHEKLPQPNTVTEKTFFGSDTETEKCLKLSRWFQK